MPFVIEVQRTVVVDIQPAQSTVYESGPKGSSEPKVVQEPCNAFQNGFLTNAQVFVQTAVQLASQYQFEEGDILVLIIPPNAGRQIKLFLVNTLFAQTKAEQIRLEYRAAFYLYAQQQQSAIVVEKEVFYTILPIISGFLQKELICYAQKEEDLPKVLKDLYENKLNFFAKKTLQNALFFAFDTPNEEKIAEQAGLSYLTVENKAALVADGISVYQMLGNISEEAFLKAEGVQGWDLRL